MTKKNKKTAVLGFVFPEIREFIDDYLRSLENQTYKDFDLIIINDGFKNFNEFSNRYKLDIEVMPYSGNIAKNREFAIKYIRDKGYKYVIFTDSDDFFAPNRVEKSLELLEDYDIVVNDITTVSLSGDILQEHYMSDRLKNLSMIDFDFLRDKNVFGFTNTSMRLKSLTEDLNFDKDLMAVDWYMFSEFLKRQCSAVFTNETISFYRIYAGNVAGLPVDINNRTIENGIDIKLFHYRELSKLDGEYKSLYEKFEQLREDIRDDKYRKKYTGEIKHPNVHKPLWWEQIRLPEELGL